MTKRYGVLVEAVRGGAETVCAEYREKTNATFVHPTTECALNCGG